jgi:hypothetical protein
MAVHKRMGTAKYMGEDPWDSLVETDGTRGSFQVVRRDFFRKRFVYIPSKLFF